MEKTYHLITVSLLIEQREQGDQLVAYREAEIALERMCAEINAAGRRQAIVKATVLESLRILECDAPVTKEIHANQHANESDNRRGADGRG